MFDTHLQGIFLIFISVGFIFGTLSEELHYIPLLPKDLKICTIGFLLLMSVVFYVGVYVLW